MISRERWISFDRRFQLLNITAELVRAETAERDGARDHVRTAIENALALVDLTVNDPKWRSDLPQLLGFREEVARQYVGQGTMPLATLSAAL